MIDLHNHILAAIDDGSRDMDESLAMARQFVSEGVSKIAATPHFDPELGNGVGGDIVRRKVDELQDAIDRAGIQLTVVPGNELYLTPDAASLLNSGAVATLGGRSCVLVETSLAAERMPLFLEDTVFRLQLAGYQPIMAHPERYPFVQRNEHAFDALVERGLIMQLTAPSLLGEYGPRVKRIAEKLLCRGLYALAASDRHHPGATRSLIGLHARLIELTDRSLADLLLRTNPERVLNGKTLQSPEPRPEVSRGWLKRWLQS